MRYGPRGPGHEAGGVVGPGAGGGVHRALEGGGGGAPGDGGAAGLRVRQRRQLPDPRAGGIGGKEGGGLGAIGSQSSWRQWRWRSRSVTDPCSGSHRLRQPLYGQTSQGEGEGAREPGAFGADERRGDGVDLGAPVADAPPRGGG